MQTHVLHFPLPDPTPQPQPIPYPAAPPLPEPGTALPLPMVHVTPTWVYKRIQRPLVELAGIAESELDVLGADGWELTSVVAEGGTVHFFFKRPTR